MLWICAMDGHSLDCHQNVPLETYSTCHMPSSNKSPEARLDISARGVWLKNQRAFFDVRVFYPNARRFKSKSLKQTYVDNEKDKKRAYNERVLQVENGTFTPLVFSVFGGMGEECKVFYKRLWSQKNAVKTLLLCPLGYELVPLLLCWGQPWCVCAGRDTDIIEVTSLKQIWSWISKRQPLDLFENFLVGWVRIGYM